MQRTVLGRLGSSVVAANRCLRSEARMAAGRLLRAAGHRARNNAQVPRQCLNRAIRQHLKQGGRINIAFRKAVMALVDFYC